MKRISYILITLAVVLFAQCKKDKSDGNPGTESAKVLKAANILDVTADKFIEIGKQKNGSVHEALALTAEWLKAHPDVKDVYMHDSIFIYIETKAGLTALFSVRLTDEQGKVLYRGGSNRGGARLKMTGRSARVITNKKVLIYAAVDYFENPKTQTTLSQSKIKFDVTVLRGTECVPRLIETFGQYGLVIINTHGDPEGFLSGVSLQLNRQEDTTEDLLKTKINAQGGSDIYDKLLRDKLRLGMSVISTQNPAWQSLQRPGKQEIWISSTYIESLAPMPGTIIFGNMCHSGYTAQDSKGRPKKPIGPPLKTNSLSATTTMPKRVALRIP